MSGKPKKGLDFFYWDGYALDNDERFDELIDAQGWNGFGVYFYVYNKICTTNGYFYEWGEKSPAHIARRMGGNIKAEMVKQVISLCLQIGLFNSKLFDGEGVLSSKEIQERYMYAIEKRSSKGRTINPKYWLLNLDETKAYIIIPENAVNLPENVHNLPENDTKESKEKKSKVKEREGTPSPYGRFQNVFLTDNEISELKQKYPLDYEREIEELSSYMESNGKHYQSHFATLIRWIERKGVTQPKKENGSSIDYDKLNKLSIPEV